MSLAPLVTNRMLSAGIGMIRLVSVHEGQPAPDDLSERQPIVWSINGEAVNAEPVEFFLEQGTYTHLGYWSDRGVWCGFRELLSPVVMPDRGVFRINPGELVEMVD